MKEQFDETGKASLELNFAGKRFRIIMENPQHLECGEYHIKSAVMEGRELLLTEKQTGDGKTKVTAVLPKTEIEKLSAQTHKIEILLDA